MIVKTKHYRLDKKIYIRLALKNVLKKQGWIAALGFIVICCGYFWVPGIWWFISAVIAGGLYILFWWIQFVGVTQLEQGKVLFEKFSYEISSQQILMKLNPKEGMPVKWEQIKTAMIGKDYFLLMMSKAQLIYWPFRIFNTDNERKFVLSILKTKGYINQH